MSAPRPYMSPDAVTVTTPRGWPPVRPWMAPRPGESKSEQIDRLHRTCFYCGHEFAEVVQTDEHELACGG